jgi:ABC-type transport system involved in multi-copper enzyme maturation permease subunit
MNFVLLIAMDTIRSIRRHRVLLAFLLLAFAGMVLVTTGITNASRHVTETERAKPHAGPTGSSSAPDNDALKGKLREVSVLFNGFFAGAMSLAGSILSLVLFCTTVASEVHTGTIRVTLAKPIPRWAYLTGKWLGATTVLGAYCLIAGVAVAGLGVLYDVQGFGLLASVPWLSFCGSLVLGTVGLVYSLYVRPPIAGVLAWFSSATWFSWFPPLYAILPSYQAFDVWQATMLGTHVGARHLILSTLYAADVVAVLLLIAHARFRRMEIA